MPSGGEYGLPEQVKFGDTNVPSKTTEHYEAPKNSREILFAQADNTKKQVRETTQQDDDGSWMNADEAKMEPIRKVLRESLKITGGVSEGDSTKTREKFYLNANGVKVPRYHYELLKAMGYSDEDIDLLTEEQHAYLYDRFLKMQESQREIEESKKRQDEIRERAEQRDRHIDW